MKMSAEYWRAYNKTPQRQKYIKDRYRRRAEEISKRGQVYRAENKEKLQAYQRNRNDAIASLFAFLREEMPGLMEEFGL